MYISNSCILPRDWTEDTLLQPHKSIPFNPSIANVFYRAGYIESWGRGIQKIFEACREVGAPDPEYTILGDSLTVKFTALERAFISQSNLPNRQIGGIDGGLAERIYNVIRNNPYITQNEIAEELKIPLRTLQRAMSELQKENKIQRIGGNRYGYWEII